MSPTPTDTPAPRFLSDEQFAAAAVADGASRHARTLRAKIVGEDDGYMVGGATSPKTGTKFPARSIPAEQFTPADAATHLADIQSNFPEDSTIHQGAWKENEHVVLDAAEDVPDRGHAQLLGETRGEKAIFDVNRGKDIKLVGGSNRPLYMATQEQTARGLRKARGL